MAKQNSSLGDWAKLGYLEKDGKLVKAETLVDPKPVKFKTGQEHLGLVKDSYKFTGQSENKKVKNAAKTIVDGITFDSKLEAYVYSLFKGARIEFRHQVEFILQPEFKYNGAHVRAIKSYVDFVLPKYNMVVDSKGYANDVAPIKFKMLKKVFADGLYYIPGFKNYPPEIEMPKNQKEVELLLNRLLYDDKYKK